MLHLAVFRTHTFLFSLPTFFIPLVLFFFFWPIPKGSFFLNSFSNPADHGGKHSASKDCGTCRRAFDALSTSLLIPFSLWLLSGLGLHLHTITPFATAHLPPSRSRNTCPFPPLSLSVSGG